jgi:hypothetical protein
MKASVRHGLTIVEQPRSGIMRSTSTVLRLCMKAVFICLLAASATAANFVTATPTAPHRGVRQTELSLDAPGGNPFFDVQLHFIFTLPDGKEVKAEGFYRGGNKWAGRAYCAEPGSWKWRSVANRPALDGKRGTFEAPVAIAMASGSCTWATRPTVT